jgi:serine/threonine protein kinase/Flp pilus assembly protein TadD
MTITPGENVGPYRVIEQLGSGGMATVFKAYHPSLDRYVAIKVLHPAFKEDPQFFERFKREARIVAKLEHPNIIPVYDFNEHKGEPYLVMRYVEGETLKPKMQGKPMPPAEVLRLMRPVCEALAYAHEQGVLHRDIKPSNIMVTQDGSIFVTDFGLARMVQAGESTLSQDMMVGTPQYISPEQARGIKDLDGRTDIYSMGVVLYEMLTGQVPFSADTPFATVHDHIYTPLPPPSKINPHIDPAVERMLLKALAKNPNDRFATVNDLREALETTLDAEIAKAPTVAQTTVDVSPPGDTKKRGTSWWVWASGATLALCIVAGLLFGLLLLGRANKKRDLRSPDEGRPAPGQVVDDDQPGPPPGGQPGQPGEPPPGGEPGQPGQPPPGGEPSQPGQPGEPPLPPGVDPDSPEYQQAAELTQQAIEAAEQGELGAAIDLFNQAIEASPNYLPAYFGLSQALKQSGDEEGSIAVLEEAVANNPDNPAAYMRLGEEYILRENPEGALEAFTRAAELTPNAPMPYAGQAMALMMMDRDDEAKQALDTALTMDPFSPEARLAKAFYLLKQGDRKEAVQELRNLVRDQRAPVYVKERARQILERFGLSSQ